MTDAYTTIECTVCRPKEGAVWIVLGGADGTRSEHLSLSAIHPDDAEAIEREDRVHSMALRVRTDVAEVYNLEPAPAVPVPVVAEPTPAKKPVVPAYGDLFGTM
jgi:hypothetical protein